MNPENTMLRKKKTLHARHGNKYCPGLSWRMPRQGCQRLGIGRKGQLPLTVFTAFQSEVLKKA